MRRSLPPAVLLLAAATASASPLGRMQAALDDANRSIAAATAQAVPVTAASSGLSYTFDPATGAFEREGRLRGQMYVERAEPLGRGKLTLSLTYQHATVTEIDGHDPDALPGGAPVRLAPGKAIGAQFAPAAFDATTHTVTASVTAGVTDDLDLSLALPVVATDARFRGRLAAAARYTSGEILTRATALRASQHRTTIGDLLLRARYRVLERAGWNAAAGLSLRLPTGDVVNLASAEELDVTPMLFATSPVWTLASWERLQAYVNGGVQFNADDVDRSEGRWGLGLDWGIGDHAVLALAAIGRHGFARSIPAGATSFVRCAGPALSDCLTSGDDRGSAPLLGLQGRRPESVFLSVGGRLSLWGDRTTAFVNVLVPVHQRGVAFDPIPLAGLETSF